MTVMFILLCFLLVKISKIKKGNKTNKQTKKRRVLSCTNTAKANPMNTRMVHTYVVVQLLHWLLWESRQIAVKWSKKQKQLEVKIQPEHTFSLKCHHCTINGPHVLFYVPKLEHCF